MSKYDAQATQLLFLEWWPAAALVLGCGGPGMMGRSLMEEAMQPADIARVEAYLRKTVGSDRIRIVTPTSHGGSIEVWAGSEFLGTLHRDDEDGEVSYSVQITILDEDLPEPAPQSAAPTRRR
jgi:Protein of unknown function (DUF3126)